MTGSPPGDEPADIEIVLSISRLLSRVLINQPSGVDRVELAYARELARQAPGRLQFAGWNPMFKRYGRLSSFWVNRYLDRLEARWTNGVRRSSARRNIDAFWWMVMLFPLPVPPKRPGKRRVLIQPSPDQLDRPRLMERIVRREGGAFVALIHDLIPIEHPEYSRPGGENAHRIRMATLVRLANGLISNSSATAQSLWTLLGGNDNIPPVRIARLGTHRVEPASGTWHPPVEPYFVCLGTIEPRKNHLLLLNVWRRLVEHHASPPRLLVIGKRGWENENIVDMLERCPAVVANVSEINTMTDGDVAVALASARALLMPTFAEGFGMPIAEALSLGTPVICSDLAALREVGGDAAEFLDPLDGPAWAQAILDYAVEPSARRAAACARGANWQPPNWTDHIQIVLQLVHEVAR